MSIQKSSKSSGSRSILPVVSFFSLVVALALIMGFHSRRQAKHIENLCAVPFRDAPQQTTLILSSGESVTGEMRITQDALIGYDYYVSFQLELPEGTLDNDIDAQDGFRKTVSYTIPSDDGKSMKTGLFIFDDNVQWPQCRKSVYVRNLTTHWIQEK